MTPHTTSTSHRWRSLFFREKRLHPLWQLLLYAPTLVLTGVLVFLLTNILLNVVGLPASVFIDAPYSLAGLARRTISTGLTVTALVVGTGIWCRLFGKRDLASLGLSFSRRGLSELGIGVLSGVGLLTIIFLIEVAMGWINVQGLAWHTQPPYEVLASLYIFGILPTIDVAMLEEIVTRGALLQTVEKWLGLPAAILISSLFFSVWHLVNPSMSGGLYFIIPFTHTLGGVLFAMLYLIRRSLWLPIGFHFAWNLCEYHIFGLTGTLPQQPTVLVTELTGPSFWVGLPNSSFGPEIGALGVLGEVLIIGVLWWMLRRRQSVGRQDISPETKRA